MVSSTPKTDSCPTLTPCPPLVCTLGGYLLESRKPLSKFLTYGFSCQELPRLVLIEDLKPSPVGIVPSSLTVKDRRQILVSVLKVFRSRFSIETWMDFLGILGLFLVPGGCHNVLEVFPRLLFSFPVIRCCRNSQSVFVDTCTFLCLLR